MRGWCPDSEDKFQFYYGQQSNRIAGDILVYQTDIFIWISYLKFMLNRHFLDIEVKCKINSMTMHFPINLVKMIFAMY